MTKTGFSYHRLLASRRSYRSIRTLSTVLVKHRETLGSNGVTMGFTPGISAVGLNDRTTSLLRTSSAVFGLSLS